MHKFLLGMCGSCLEQDVPLLESTYIEEDGKKVKNRTIIRNLFRRDFSEEFLNWKLCENCSISLKGAVNFKNSLLSSQLAYSKQLKTFNDHNHRRRNQFLILSVDIQENRIKHEMFQGSTKCTTDVNGNGFANTEMQLDVETFDNDLIETTDVKIEKDESIHEKFLNDFRCETETVKKKMEVKKENVIEFSPVMLMDGHRIDQFSKETQKDGSGFSCANVETEIDAVENTHRRKDTGENPYKCDLSVKSYSNKNNYKAHRRVHTGKKPYKCDFCAKAFSKKSYRNRHRRVHTGKKPYKCDLCVMAFLNKSKYNKHRRVHIGEKPYKCDFCAEAFSKISKYNIHKWGHTGEKPYNCDLCAKAFFKKSYYEEHKRKHTGEKPYKCDLCVMAYLKKSKYNRHRRVHEKPYKCYSCAEAFLEKSQYYIHRLVHTAEKFNLKI